MIYQKNGLNLRERILEFISYGEEMDKKFKSCYVPRYLYKYKKLNEYTIDELENSYEFSANPLTFNDIFDSRNNIDNTDIEILKNKQMTENILKLDNEIITGIDLIKDEFVRKCAIKTIGGFEYMTGINRIICFSENNYSNLMWSHYAEKHTGICLEYKFEKNTDDLCKYMFPVKYTQKPINTAKLKICDYKKYDNQVELDNILSVITKSDDWSYEKEWRFILGEVKFGECYDGMKIEFLKPNKILLGSKFFEILNILLENKEKKDCAKKIEERLILTKKLFDFAIKNDISIEMSIPVIGTYKLENLILESEKISTILTNERNYDNKIRKIIEYIREIRIKKYIDKF